MSKPIAPDAWVFVVVQDETIIGQRDAVNDIAFIPFFESRETAMQGVLQMAKTPGKPLEIQAIIFEDLVRYATQEASLLFKLDGGGQILSKMGPDGRDI